MADAALGLIVVVALATVLAVLLNRTNRASAALAESRAATRLAERVLLEIQGGTFAAGPEIPVRIRRLPARSPVAGKAWIEVMASQGSRTASLIGLVDDQAARKLEAAP